MIPDDELHAAGRRAAAVPVPDAPPMDVIESSAGRHRRRRRMARGGVVAVALVALGVPVGAALRDEGGTERITAAAEPSAVVGDPGTGGDTPVADPDDPAVDPTRPEGEAEVRVETGDRVVSARVVAGPGAADEATAAADAADETRATDRGPVWLRAVADDRTAAATLLDDETFVEVTGPSERITAVVDRYASGDPWFGPAGVGGEGPPFAWPPDEAWLEERLGDLEGSAFAEAEAGLLSPEELEAWIEEHLGGLAGTWLGDWPSVGEWDAWFDEWDPTRSPEELEAWIKEHLGEFDATTAEERRAQLPSREELEARIRDHLEGLELPDGWPHSDGWPFGEGAGPPEGWPFGEGAGLPDGGVLPGLHDDVCLSIRVTGETELDVTFPEGCDTD